MPASATRRDFITLSAAAALALAGCGTRETSQPQTDDPQGTSQMGEDTSAWILEEGDTTQRGFRVDDVLHAGDHGDIHFSIHVPDSYDGSLPYALYVALPGWEGLLFQGVGANLQEDFPFVANGYVPDMIVATPQLEDWGEASADQTIALTRWLLDAYDIDPTRVVLSGCSGGGETASIVAAEAPGLLAAVLHCISRWDGDIEPVVAARLPVYMAIGEEDDYYGADYDRATYQDLVDAYRADGLSEDEIADLVTLDVKPASYFGETGERYGQHAGGGALFPHDEQIMGWLFSHA
jgi:predicted peptidase